MLSPSLQDGSCLEVQTHRTMETKPTASPTISTQQGIQSDGSMSGTTPASPTSQSAQEIDSNNSKKCCASLVATIGIRQKSESDPLLGGSRSPHCPQDARPFEEPHRALINSELHHPNDSHNPSTNPDHPTAMRASSAPTILSVAYAPPISYFAYLFRGNCQIEAHENYHKQSYRNRCIIASPQGRLPLTIPVVSGASSQCPIREVRIALHDDWQHKHWQALSTSYGNTPFFEYYAPDLERFYRKPLVSPYLFDYLSDYLSTLAELLHMDKAWQYTSDFANPEDDNNLCHKLQPKSRWQDPHFVPHKYYQSMSLGRDFVPNLSILDLLFNMGPESLILLQRSFSPQTAHNE